MTFQIAPSSRTPRQILGCCIAAAIGLAVLIAAPGVAAAAEPPVGLGSASSYAVLAGSTVTNTGSSVISGDLAVSPQTAITGFPPGLVNGTIHSADAEALQAKADLTLAYDDAAGRGPAASVAAELGGLTFEPGVYSGATLELTGTLTLDAKGDPDAVFVFKSASTLVTASNSNIVLIGSAQPCNVYWQVGSSATLGTGTAFVGTTMALASITANTGATVQGRLLARNGAVTLDTNVISLPTCASAAPSSTPTPSATTTPAETTSASPTAAPSATTTPPETTSAGPTAAPSATTTPPETTSASPPVTTTNLALTGGRVDSVTLIGLVLITLGTGALAMSRRRAIARR